MAPQRRRRDANLHYREIREAQMARAKGRSGRRGPDGWPGLKLESWGRLAGPCFRAVTLR